jgi:hypothetical protein
MSNFDVDGTYFTSAWNAATGILGNTTGYGIKLQGFSAHIDIALYNCAEVGLLMEEPVSSPSSSDRAIVSTISVSGNDFGKEGIILRGPNDFILDRSFIGRAGILPRPAAETAFATSTEYPAETVDGIVLDGINVEIGEVHTFAHWSGSGFRTRNTVRLTRGGRVISESNNNQVRLSSGTYGSAFFDIRNLSLFHPDWTAATPSYTSPDERWDGATIASNTFSCEVTCRRTITAPSRVTGTSGIVVSGEAEVKATYSNSTAPSGDPEVGVLYSGDAVQVSGRSSKVSARVDACNGDSVLVNGEGCLVDFSVSDGINGAGLKRDSVGNSKRGNNIRGTVNDCDTGFESVGTPSSENIDVSMELAIGDVPFTGDTPDLFKSQHWNISANVNNVNSSTKRFLQGALSSAVTTDQTVVIAHEFLYTPSVKEIQLTLDDASTPSTAYLDYLMVNAVDATNVTVGYKFATTDVTGAANHRVNVRVG